RGRGIEEGRGLGPRTIIPYCVIRPWFHYPSRRPGSACGLVMERLRFGRYETLRRIASGGMASVYLGRAVGPAGFERLVAIKVMHEHILGDPEFRGMFLDEARLAAKIRHPNVVPTLDVSADGRFIVMDFIE